MGTLSCLFLSSLLGGFLLAVKLQTPPGQAVRLRCEMLFEGFGSAPTHGAVLLGPLFSGVGG